MHSLVRGIQKSIKHSISEFRRLHGKPQLIDFSKVKDYGYEDKSLTGSLHTLPSTDWKEFAKNLDKAASKQKFIETAKTR